MSVMSPSPIGGSLMTAWENYRNTESFSTSMEWAMAREYQDGRPISKEQQTTHAAGSLWAAFSAGWDAANALTEKPISERDWLASNFCEVHRNLNSFTCGPCGMCERDNLIRALEGIKQIIMGHIQKYAEDQVSSITLPCGCHGRCKGHTEAAVSGQGSGK